jgi:hypothetical protein
MRLASIKSEISESAHQKSEYGYEDEEDYYDEEEYGQED